MGPAGAEAGRLTAAELALLALAAAGAGAINALAGGGSILTFPALLAAGVPPVAANVTNTVALLPGYVGGVWAQRRDLDGQDRRLAVLLPVGAIGGLLGGFLLLRTSDEAFAAVVPALLIGASVLLALQDRLRGWLGRRTGAVGLAWAAPPALLAAVYGGYFGAGLSVIFLAVLGLALADTLARLNALKQALSLAVNIAAAALFVGSGEVHWPAALAMAGGALLGGAAGGKLARVVRPGVLRALVVAMGVALAAVFALG